MAKVMWQMKTRHFTVVWRIENDALNTSYMDPDMARECRENVRSGKWKCFTSEIQVIENGSKVALGESFLGNSIYENPADFRDHLGMNRKGHGSYFSQMVREAIAEARKAFPAHQKRIAREVAAKQGVLSVRLRSSAKTTA